MSNVRQLPHKVPPHMQGMPRIPQELQQKRMARQPMMLPDYSIANPLPAGVEGAKLLRGMQRCPIPMYSQRLDSLIRTFIEKKDYEKVDKACSSISSIMTADLICEASLKSRPVVKFAEDTELEAMSQQMSAIALEAASLGERIKELEQQYNTIEQDRFNKAVSKYGLNTKERLYRINEADDTIELVEADCENCQSKQKLQKNLEELSKD